MTSNRFPSNRSLLIGVALSILSLSPRATGQCVLIIEGDPSTQRTGPNQVRGTATIYPAQMIQGSWAMTLRSVVRFTPTGGSEGTVASTPTSFNWGPGTATGSGSAQSAVTNEPLESHGNGAYRTRQEVSGVCSGATYDPGVKTSPSVAIARPAFPTYVTANRYLTYLNGAASNYTTTDTGASFATTVTLQAGNANGATGSPTWVLIQSGAAATYASLSCTSCPTPTQTDITAQHESDGCLVYNVQVKTNYGGLLSEPLFVAIERPKKALKPPGLPDPDPAPAGSAGYQSVIRYVTEGLCSAQGYLQGYSLNEEFTNYSPVESNNWPLQAAGTTLGPTSNLWADTITAIAGSFCNPGLFTLCSPAPEDPNSPLSTRQIQSADQAWRVGSTALGTGIVIQRNTFRRFIDHGDHTAIVSPSN